uniref:Uncharacterized protein n=1 Tax=Anguilla anguilla TaxID=7936 RepID=A0A0E9QGM6_ANGAN
MDNISKSKYHCFTEMSTHTCISCINHTAVRMFEVSIETFI